MIQREIEARYIIGSQMPDGYSSAWHSSGAAAASRVAVAAYLDGENIDVVVRAFCWCIDMMAAVKKVRKPTITYLNRHV